MISKHTRHQCPNCLTAHFNPNSRLCPPCNRKALLADLIGAACVFGTVWVIGLLLLSL